MHSLRRWIGLAVVAAIAAAVLAQLPAAPRGDIGSSGPTVAAGAPEDHADAPSGSARIAPPTAS